jgi:hypothetical protein
MKKNKSDFSSWHVGVAAEAIAAGQFARLGYDVSVQYGADQPEYDLIISKGREDTPLKVSVKGSKSGSWGLTQGFLKKGKKDYRDAIDKWLQRHGRKTIFCLVQFKKARINELPRVYLATPFQISEQLRKVAYGKGGTILYEKHTWTRQTATGYGSTEKIPDEWIFSEERLEQIKRKIVK